MRFGFGRRAGPPSEALDAGRSTAVTSNGSAAKTGCRPSAPWDAERTGRAELGLVTGSGGLVALLPPFPSTVTLPFIGVDGRRTLLPLEDMNFEE